MRPPNEEERISLLKMLTAEMPLASDVNLEKVIYLSVVYISEIGAGGTQHSWVRLL